LPHLCVGAHLTPHTSLLTLSALSGSKKKNYHVAADSQQEAHVWLHTILEAPKDSTKSVRGFLWVESAQTGKWNRCYCIADPTHFEWFRTKDAVRAVSHEAQCSLVRPHAALLLARTHARAHMASFSSAENV
jgi:hypothetical protein